MAATIPIIDIVTTTEDTTTTVTGMETLVYSGAELGTDETVDREAVGAGERELGTAVVMSGRAGHRTAVGHCVNLQNPSKSLISVPICSQ